MLELSRAQDENVGDGTTSVVILGEFSLIIGNLNQNLTLCCSWWSLISCRTLVRKEYSPTSHHWSLQESTWWCPWSHGKVCQNYRHSQSWRNAQDCSQLIRNQVCHQIPRFVLWYRYRRCKHCSHWRRRKKGNRYQEIRQNWKGFLFDSKILKLTPIRFLEATSQTQRSFLVLYYQKISHIQKWEEELKTQEFCYWIAL